LGQLTSMSDDEDDNDWDSAPALRAKAAHCISLTALMGEETRARLIRIATEYLERAAQLERDEKN
jgi:hypothetical protein